MQFEGVGRVEVSKVDILGVIWIQLEECIGVVGE
jgi:hypothetical protein